MDIWLTFAYISNNEVKNIACYLYTGYTEANDHAKAFCEDEEAIAVEVTHIPVQIGDTYDNGTFKRNGEVIAPIPSVAQQTATNTTDIAGNSNSIDDLWVAVLEG